MSLKDEMVLYTKLSGKDGNHTSIGIIGAYLDGYERGKADQPHWIPCSERLPKEAGWYIVTMPYDITGFRWYSTAHGFEKFEGGGDVIAWMPLPPVYKGELNDN